MEHGSTFLMLATIFGFLMAWGVGANDVANAMGTSVGSKAVTIQQALVIATIFEFSGAYLAGGQVTDTIRNGIIQTDLIMGSPEILVFGMLAALAAAAVWLLVASYFGWPVSTTHTIIGAIVGFGVAQIGLEAIKWNKVFYIIASWLVSPITGGLIAFLLFTSMQKLILNARHPVSAAKRIIPIYVFFSSWVIAMVTFVKGLKHIGLKLSTLDNLLYGFLFSLIITFLSQLALRRVKIKDEDDKALHFKNIERVFGVLMVFTACAMAFAHGSNDVANAIGPLAAIAGIVHAGGNVTGTSEIPNWILFLGALGIVTGLVTYGHKVIATIGRGITELTPSRGFAATLAAACTVVLASGTGMPVSTTHTLVGAVFGVGLARGIGALNLNVIGTIFLSWIVTLPAGAILAIMFYQIIASFF